MSVEERKKEDEKRQEIIWLLFLDLTKTIAGAVFPHSGIKKLSAFPQKKLCLPISTTKFSDIIKSFFIHKALDVLFFWLSIVDCRSSTLYGNFFGFVLSKIIWECLFETRRSVGISFIVFKNWNVLVEYVESFFVSSALMKASMSYSWGFYAVTWMEIDWKGKKTLLSDGRKF